MLVIRAFSSKRRKPRTLSTRLRLGAPLPDLIIWPRSLIPHFEKSTGSQLRDYGNHVFRHPAVNGFCAQRYTIAWFSRATRDIDDDGGEIN